MPATEQVDIILLGNNLHDLLLCLILLNVTQYDYIMAVLQGNSCWDFTNISNRLLHFQQWYGEQYNQSKFKTIEDFCFRKKWGKEIHNGNPVGRQSHTQNCAFTTINSAGPRDNWLSQLISCVTLQFDVWPWKTIGHLYYATSSPMHHFVAIGEFKLELQSGNAQFGSKSTIFLAVWPWNFTYDLEKQ